MTDYSELKRLAETLLASDDHADFPGWMAASDAFDNATGPAAVLALIAENERLTGLQPSLPPRPPEGDGLPRFGLRWNGPSNPLAVSMDDGYWTPWHLADLLKAENEELVDALNEILRVTPMGVEAFGIAALVLGELGVNKEVQS